MTRPLLLLLLLTFTLLALPALANKVTIRDGDQMLLVDGQPFFPVGLYYPEEEIADETGALLKDLRATGFNTVFFHAPEGATPATKAKLDRIAAAGLHTQFRPPGDLLGEYDKLKKAVAEYKDHPAMLLWEHSDEPVVNNTKFDQLLPGYKLMEQLDPDHPVLMVEYPYWNREPELRKMATACDVYAFDKYPVPLKRWFLQGKDIPHGWPHSIAIMGEVTAWWRTLAPGKPVISILQAWNRRPKEDGPAGHPTTAQSRFMAYQCVIRGANGILYYGKIRVKSPHTPSSIPPEINADPKITERDFQQAKALNDAFWADFKNVVKEVGDMTPVFAAKDADWTPKITLLKETGAKVSDIQVRVKKHGDATVILMVNASTNPAAVQFTAPGMKKLIGWHNSPGLASEEQGAWMTTLEPFGVAIYSDHEKL